MIRIRGLAAFSLLFLLVGCAQDDAPEAGVETAAAQHFPSDAEIQALIQSRVDENRTTGIIVGVMEADGSTRVFTAGEAGEGAQPLGERSVFEIGSITKVFTGIILADMVWKGEVSYDDPVQKYLPADEVTVPTWQGQEITLLDIATHRSALPRMPDNFDPADENNPYADYTVADMYEFLSNHELRRAIGAEPEYSNLAMGLLGHALARAAGTDYETLVQQRVLEPLGMDNSGITLSDEMQQWLAIGHGMDGEPVANWDLPTLAGAGALRSDMIDMLTFIDANIGPAETPLEEVMRETHVERGEFGGPNEVGLNWIITNQGDDRIVWHNGGTGGYRTYAGFDPDRNVGAVVLTNSGGSGSDDIGMHLINSAIPLAPKPPDRVEIEVSQDVLEQYVGSYALAPEFVITVTVEDGTIWAQATNQPIVQIYPESETEFFYKVVDAQITFEKDDDGNVTGLTLHQMGRDMPAPKQ